MLPVPALAIEAVTGRIDVLDADTWDVGGVRVRLHGIDAPEISQTCRRANGAEWDCGRWVTQETRRAYDGQRARCRPVDRDRYGRVVATCTVAGQDAGQALVARGLAFAFRKYSTAYVPQEQAAMAAGKGLHAGEVQKPWLYRAAGRKSGGSNCQIKGNISSKGERIFHVPGQAFYTRTKINTAKGERWFCSAKEARAAGWRAAKR